VETDCTKLLGLVEHICDAAIDGEKWPGLWAVAVAIVDADAKLLFANSQAERLLSAGSMLTVTGGQVRAVSIEGNRRLSQRIRDAVATAGGIGARTGSVIGIEDDNQIRRAMMVAPLRSDSPFGFPFPCAMLFIGGPQADGFAVKQDVLREIYELTGAEAKLLSALLRGDCLQDFVKQAGISLATAKTQLQQVFDKTGCHRQSDLVRTVLADPVIGMTR